jgi:hypothetical protein
MTTHPTSVNAGSVDDDYRVSGADHMPDLRSGLIGQQPLTITVDLGALITPVNTIATNWRKADEASPISTIAC